MIIWSGSWRENNRPLLRPLVIALLILMAGGCAPVDQASRGRAIKEKGKSPKSVEARYPRSAYVTAWGMGTESEREAELDARARVAEQIRSQISSEVVSFAEALMRDEEIHDYQRLFSEVRTVAQFSHN
nr:LPP20 family lipoprotein [Candidatus Krumholzibacteriota bacterium]